MSAKKTAPLTTASTPKWIPYDSSRILGLW